MIADVISDDVLSFIRSFNENLDTELAAWALESSGLEEASSPTLALRVAARPSATTLQIKRLRTEAHRSRSVSDAEFVDAISGVDSARFFESFAYEVRDTGGRVRWGHMLDFEAWPMLFGFIESPVAFRVTHTGDLQIRGCWTDWPHTVTRAPFEAIATLLGQRLDDPPLWRTIDLVRHENLFEVALDCMAQLIDDSIGDADAERLATGECTLFRSGHAPERELDRLLSISAGVRRSGSFDVARSGNGSRPLLSNQQASRQGGVRVVAAQDVEPQLGWFGRWRDEGVNGERLLTWTKILVTAALLIEGWAWLDRHQNDALVEPGGTDCTPGYGVCIPEGSDVDCLGGVGNGPRYVRGPISVTGSDPFNLDTDNDGVGCE